MTEYDASLVAEETRLNELLKHRDPRKEPIRFRDNSVPVETPVEFLDKLIEPSQMENSNAHGYIVNDPALSRLPNEEYAEIMADYMRVSGIFKELGYPKIGSTIHAEMEGKAWALMGVKGWLRDKINETRSVFVKGETKAQDTGIRAKIDNMR